MTTWRVKYDLHITIIATVLLVAATTGWTMLMVRFYPHGNQNHDHSRARNNLVSDTSELARKVAEKK